MDEEEVRKIFAQVRSELYFPPCELEIGDDVKNDSPFFVVNSKVHISPRTIPNNVDKKKYLRSVIRHEIAHLHYCPYDMRTAYELVKEAYNSCKDWEIAYFSLLLFTDLNVDCFYLFKKFGEVPYHVDQFLNSSPRGTGKYIQAAYRRILNKDFGEYSYDVESIARQISTVMKSERNWFSKVRLIALILSLNKVKAKVPKHLAGPATSIPLREDLSKNTIEKINEVLGGVKSSEEARKFYEYWIKPRLKNSELEEVKRTFEKGGKRSGERKSRKGEFGKTSPVKPESGEEPKLPTNAGKPYPELTSKMVEELLWKVFWYRARAKRTMLIYLEEGKRPEPNLAISSYPIDWNIEDEVEDLDLESSLDEGRLRIEINTVKWNNVIKGKGSSLTISNVPSSLIVLDTSKSMQDVIDDAATSAFICLLSAERMGGNAASITFSTDYFSVDWQGSTLEKEVALSLYFGGMTILPLNEIMRLVSESENKVLINIITDCGWQNIEEALPFLEKIVEEGHRVKIFRLDGGRYPENVRMVSKVAGIKIIPVKVPEMDLQYLVAKETSEDYGGSALVFKA